MITAGGLIVPTVVERVEGLTDTLKSGGGGGGDTEPPPQPIRTNKAAQANERMRKRFLRICHLLRPSLRRHSTVGVAAIMIEVSLFGQVIPSLVPV